MISHWLPEDFLKTIVLFVLKGEKGEEHPHGTGILVRIENTYMLVTCKHIVVNPNTKEYYKGLQMWVNRVDNTVSKKDIDAIHTQFNLRWFFHTDENVDIAISPIAIEEGQDDIKTMPFESFEDFSLIPLGEDIFFLGYPHGLGIENVPKLSPLVRTGIVALKLGNKTFFIDANVYPGSSGSPVFYKPSIAQKEKTTINIGKLRDLKMLGIVSDNLSSIEEAISKRTGRTRAVFEENSGLGVVQSAELIKEIVSSAEFQKIIPKTEKAQKTEESSSN